MEQEKQPKIAWFKRYQREEIYHYYEVHGGPGKTKDGYVVAVRFLCTPPSISVEHNYEHDPSGLTGTWCHYEASEPITEAEFRRAYQWALNDPHVVIR